MREADVVYQERVPSPLTHWVRYSTETRTLELGKIQEHPRQDEQENQKVGRAYGTKRLDCSLCAGALRKRSRPQLRFIHQRRVFSRAAKLHRDNGSHNNEALDKTGTPERQQKDKTGLLKKYLQRGTSPSCCAC